MEERNSGNESNFSTSLFMKHHIKAIDKLPSKVPEILPSISQLEDFISTPMKSVRHDHVVKTLGLDDDTPFVKINCYEYTPKVLHHLDRFFSRLNLSQQIRENEMESEEGIDMDYDMNVEGNEEQKYRYSALNKNEHFQYINMEKKLAAHRKNPSLNSWSDNQNMVFERILKIVKAEQMEYLQKERSEMMKNVEMFYVVNDKILESVHKMFTFRRKKVVEMYPKYYRIVERFSVTKKDDRLQPDFDIINANVLNLGKCGLIEFDPNASLPLPVETNVFCGSATEVNAEEITPPRPSTIVVSKDPYVLSILSERAKAKKKGNEPKKVQFVASLSTLIELLDTHQKYGSSFACKEVSVPVKVVKMGDLKVVFLEKALPDRLMTPVEVNCMFYRKALRTLLNKKGNNYIDFNAKDEHNVTGNDGRGNLHYAAYSFGDMDILLRHKFHGYCQRDKNDATSVLFSILSAKMEYFFSEGKSFELSRSESCRNLFNLTLRPLPENEIALISANIDVHRSVCVGMSKVVRDDLRAKFDEAFCRQFLYSVMKKVEPLDEGTYLVQRYEGNEVVVREACNEKTTFCLHEEISKYPQIVNRFDYVPLKWTGTNSDQIPFTFQPRPGKKRKKKGRKSKIQ